MPTTKQYTLRAYMRSSTGTSTPIYSNGRFFYTVAQPFGQTVLPSTSLPSGNVSATGGAATTSVGVSVGSGGIGATTTLSFVNPDSILPSNLSGMFKQKFPFSYLYDSYVLIQELAGGTSGPNAIFTLPLGAQFTNPAGGTSTSIITVFNTTAITNTGYITGTRSLIEMSLYFVTAMYLLGYIMKAI